MATDRPTPAQRRYYRHLCVQLGLDDDARRAITARVCRRRSTASITQAQMGRLIGELVHLAGGDTSANDYTQTVPGGATRAQVGKIKRLEAALGWSTNPDRLAGFIERQTTRTIRVYAAPGQPRAGRTMTAGKRDVEQLTKREASEFIEALKEWAARGAKA